MSHAFDITATATITFTDEEYENIVTLAETYGISIEKTVEDQSNKWWADFVDGCYVDVADLGDY